MKRLLVVVLGIACCQFSYGRKDDARLFLVNVKAKTSAERSKLADAGIAIDGIFSDGVSVFATEKEIQSIKKLGFVFERTELPQRAFRDFPSSDKDFHNYTEMNAKLDKLVKDYPALVSKYSIGKSIEGRELYGVRISSKGEEDSLPTAVFLGCHHAREHLSVEVPLRLAVHLAESYGSDKRITQLLDTREVWVVPMVNPDGAEYDIDSGRYKWWRKNRVSNSGGGYGVDLNRNYAKGFGGPGASNNPSSDTYHGPSAFSEPETAAVRDFLKERKKATVLISYHTFSELVLWPWGGTNDVISNDADRKVFETMGRKMASWNGYKPQKSSDLYVASGDTTDWAYDELGIFAFTFELSPSSLFGGGFYPGASAIKPTFNENIEPALYLIEKAENPYRAIQSARDPLGIL